MLPKLTKRDLDIYLQATDKQKLKYLFGGEDSIARINKMQEEVIFRFYSQTNK